MINIIYCFYWLHPNCTRKGDFHLLCLLRWPEQIKHDDEGRFWDQSMGASAAFWANPELQLNGWCDLPTHLVGPNVARFMRLSQKSEKALAKGSSGKFKNTKQVSKHRFRKIHSVEFVSCAVIQEINVSIVQSEPKRLKNAKNKRIWKAEEATE